MYVTMLSVIVIPAPDFLLPSHLEWDGRTGALYIDGGALHFFRFWRSGAKNRRIE